MRQTVAALAAALAAAAITTAPAVRADGPDDEQNFLNALKAAPCAMGGCGRSTAAELLDRGYRACAVMDEYPKNGLWVYYKFFDDPYAGAPEEGDFRYLGTVAAYLCQRHKQLFPQQYGG